MDIWLPAFTAPSTAPAAAPLNTACTTSTAADLTFPASPVTVFRAEVALPAEAVFLFVDEALDFLADPVPDFFPDEEAFFDLPDPGPVDPVLVFDDAADELFFADGDDELFFAEVDELFFTDDDDELFLADDELFFADPPEVELPFAEEVFPVDLVAAILNILPARKFK